MVIEKALKVVPSILVGLAGYKVGKMAIEYLENQNVPVLNVVFRRDLPEAGGLAATFFPAYAEFLPFGVGKVFKSELGQAFAFGVGLWGGARTLRSIESRTQTGLPISFFQPCPAA